MNPREVNRQLRRVQRFTRRWQPLLVPDYKVYYKFSSDLPEGDEDTVLKVKSRWDYLHAHIEAFLPNVARHDDDDLEEFVVHEFMHIRLAFLGKAGAKQEERVATELAQAFIRVAAPRQEVAREG